MRPTRFVADVSAIVAVAFAGPTFLGTAHAQTTPTAAGTACAVKRDSVGRFPIYTLYRMPSERVTCLRQALAAGQFEQALELYYPDSRRPEFVNWVIYLGDTTVRHAIMQHGVRRTELRGEKYIWVTVFSENDLPALSDSAAQLYKDTADVLFTRRSTNYQRDPLLAALYKTFVGKLLGGDLPSTPVAIDSSRTLEFSRLSEGEQDPLYIAQGRLGLAENTTVSLSLSPALRKRFRKGAPRAMYANLGNAAASRFEVALGLGVQMGSRVPVITDTLRTGESAAVRPNVYLLMHTNLIRPQLPWKPFSFGVAVGTNVVRGGLLDEVVTALSFGRLIGDGGVAVGAAWQNEIELQDAPGVRPQRRERRVPRLFLALDFRL